MESTIGINPTVLILGGSGFIGKNLLCFLSGKRWDVQGLSSSEVDLTNNASIETLLGKYSHQTVLVIAAAITRDLRSEVALNQNIAIVRTVIEAMQFQKPVHCVFFSSSDIYGNANDRLPIHEETLCNPISFYSVSKLVGEVLLTQFCSQNKIPLTILRFGGIYGQGNAHGHVVNNFIEAVINDRQLVIYGDGTDTRDYVCISDLCTVVERILSGRILGVLNVVTGVSHSILKIAQIVMQCFDHKAKICFEPRQRELLHYCYNNIKISDVMREFAFMQIPDFVRNEFGRNRKIS